MTLTVRHASSGATLVRVAVSFDVKTTPFALFWDLWGIRESVKTNAHTKGFFCREGIPAFVEKITMQSSSGVTVLQYSFTAGTCFASHFDKRRSNYERGLYTGGIPQWLDTDVCSTLTVKLSTASWQQERTQRGDSDSADSNVAVLTVLTTQYTAVIILSLPPMSL